MAHENPDGTPVTPPPPTIPPVEPADELTDRDNFDHPDPSDKPIKEKPPEVTPEPEPELEIAPRLDANLEYSLAFFVDSMTGGLTRAWKNLDIAHIVDNYGMLYPEGSEPIRRWRNTRLRLLGVVHIITQIIYRTDLYSDAVADYLIGQRHHFYHESFGDLFYHEHDVDWWSNTFQLGEDGLVPAAYSWESTLPPKHEEGYYEFILGHPANLDSHTDYESAVIWKPPARPIEVRFDPNQTIEQALAEMRKLILGDNG